MSEQETIVYLRQQVLDLERKLNFQKHQIRQQDETLHQKNLSLDAYHHVWCDGSCQSGVHRYHDFPLTEAIVLKAEYNTKRLRTKFNNLVFGAVWKRLSDEEKAKIHEDCRVTMAREWRDVVHELLERFEDLQVK